MANRRNLKKDIDYLCDELTFEALGCMLQSEPDNVKLDELLARIDNLNIEFRRRIQNPDGKDNKQLVKQYYQQLHEDFDAETEKIYMELKSLNVEKGAN